MNKFKKLMCLFLSILMILSMGIPAFAIDKTASNSTSTNETQKTAVNAEKNPLEITIATDKAEYKVTNVAEITATVTNTGKEDIKNVSAEAIFNDLAPVGKKTSETKKEVETLKAGESISFTYKATLNAKAHKLNIFQKIFLWFVRLFNGGYTPSDNGFDNGRDCTEQTNTMSFGKFESVNTVRVWYGENGSISDNEDTVTRGEWILKLADTLDWSEQIKMMNNTNCEFDDIEGHKCEKAVQYASIMNVFDETAGSFYPDEPATREFAAVTAVRAMGFLNTETIECADKNSIKHPYEVHSAVTIGIFELSNNKFYADKEFTVKESEKAIAKISEIEGTRQNTPEHSEIVYNDNFVELSNNVKYTQINDEKFSIEKSEETSKLQAGQIVFLNDEYYKISEIIEENGQYVITTSEPSMQEIFQSINVGGSKELSVGDFIPAEGVEVIEQQRKARSSIDIGQKSLKIDHKIQENVKIYGEIAIKNPKVDFNVDIDWSNVSWSNWIPNFKDVHMTLELDTEAKAGISDTRTEKAPLKDGAITLGSFPVFGVAGVGIYVEVALGYTIEGKAEIVFSTNCKSGYQILNNIPKQIASFSAKYDMTTIEASLKAGLKISGLLEITKKCKLIDFDIFGGAAIKGSLKIRDTGLTCLNASAYAFAKLEAMQESVIGNWLDVKCSYDIWKEENSPLKKNWHFENMVRVPECTYEDLKWQFKNSELIISGNGKMPNYSTSGSNCPPWYEYKDSITAVTVKSNITSIGDYAFADLTNLNKVTIADSVKTIGFGAFYNCTTLTSIDLNDKLTELGDRVFSNCTSLTSINLGNSLQKIGYATFLDCYELKELTLPASITSSNYVYYDGISSTRGLVYLYTNPNYETYQKFYGRYGNIGALAGSYIEKVTISNGATLIPNYIFSGNVCLKEVIIPNSVTGIGQYAFYNCKQFSDIKLNHGLQSIGARAFQNTAIESIVIPNTVVNMGYYSLWGYDYDTSCFGYSNIIKKVVFENGIKSIPRSACTSCSSLVNVVIPESVTSIERFAFNGCSNLIEIKIPKEVENIDIYAFTGCSNLININVEDTNDTYSSFEGALYNKGKTKLLQCPMGKEKVKIYNGTTTICARAFMDCSDIEEIIIPSSVTNIGDNAFDGCIKLKNIAIPDTVIDIGYEAFNDCDSLECITINNPNCTIYDSKYTINDTATIYGYSGSTAEAYAKKYNRAFIALD